MYGLIGKVDEVCRRYEVADCEIAAEDQQNTDSKHQVEHDLPDKRCSGNVAVDNLVIAQFGTRKCGGKNMMLSCGIFLRTEASQSLKSL